MNIVQCQANFAENALFILEYYDNFGAKSTEDEVKCMFWFPKCKRK